MDKVQKAINASCKIFPDVMELENLSLSWVHQRNMFWANLIQLTHSQLISLSIHFNIIFTLAFMSQADCFHEIFQPEFCAHVFLSHVCYMSRPSLNCITHDEHGLWSLLACFSVAINLLIKEMYVQNVEPSLDVFYFYDIGLLSISYLIKFQMSWNGSGGGVL